MSHWTPLHFGKHDGLTLPQIIFKDPDWFFWSYANGVFRKSNSRLQSEVQEIFEKATHIRIPQAGKKIAYIFNYRTSLLENVQLVSNDDIGYTGYNGGNSSIIEDHLDFSIARLFKPYDKLGNRILVKAFKYILFGNSSARISKKKGEDFFDDDSNFRIKLSRDIDLFGNVIFD